MPRDDTADAQPFGWDYNYPYRKLSTPTKSFKKTYWKKKYKKGDLTDEEWDAKKKEIAGGAESKSFLVPDARPGGSWDMNKPDPDAPGSWDINQTEFTPPPTTGPGGRATDWDSPEFIPFSEPFVKPIQGSTKHTTPSGGTSYTPPGDNPMWAPTITSPGQGPMSVTPEDRDDLTATWEQDKIDAEEKAEKRRLGDQRGDDDLNKDYEDPTVRKRTLLGGNVKNVLF